MFEDSLKKDKIENQEHPQSPDQPRFGILDTVSYQEQNAALRSFNPQGFIFDYLQKLKPREQQILDSRYGLGDGEMMTLEIIGKRLGLTRERVRQIEREALHKLKQLPMPQNFEQGVDLIFKIIEDKGNIAREDSLLEAVLTSNNTRVARNGILFVLSVIPRFNVFKETGAYNRSWYVNGFDVNILTQVIASAKKVLGKVERPLTLAKLIAAVKQEIDSEEISALTNEGMESYFEVSKSVGRNPYEEWGIQGWPEISPKDVGDKAFLVLSHLNKPEHYSKITEFINKQGFDARVAHKETVHNELIKDRRFVLVGRGIYALAKWGYKPGVVADIIREILQKAGTPLSREEIITAVLKQRLVKKNTIIVGLSNRKKFIRTADNKYTNNAQ